MEGRFVLAYVHPAYAKDFLKRQMSSGDLMTTGNVLRTLP